MIHIFMYVTPILFKKITMLTHQSSIRSDSKFAEAKRSHFQFIDWLHIVLQPFQKYLAQKGTSPLTEKGCKTTYCRVKEVEGVPRQTCYDMGPRFTSEGPPLYLSIEKYWNGWNLDDCHNYANKSKAPVLKFS